MMIVVVPNQTSPGMDCRPRSLADRSQTIDDGLGWNTDIDTTVHD
ncbi:hypothetical protein RE6C_02249 [Rhodopirellula europaea 6C]|uniref:Uncharacterized protein n=1 Tax=Rhodopirellula europaea 6C TaxID=1263867 RepID=M2A772_9BACT|nr:hypothetical protein RE6C_02249 [Rhodopirellula europaea 6C]